MVQTAHRSEFFAGNRKPSSPHVQTPEEIGVEWQEAEEFVVGFAAEDADERGLPAAGRHEDVGLSVAIDIFGRDPRTAEERRVEGRDGCDLRMAQAADDKDIGGAGGARAHDHIGDVVAVHVAGRDEYAAAKGRPEWQKAEQLVVVAGRVENTDLLRGPAPPPTMTSALPSPFTSPAATRTPPANAASKAKK